MNNPYERMATLFPQFLACVRYQTELNLDLPRTTPRQIEQLAEQFRYQPSESIVEQYEIAWDALQRHVSNPPASATAYFGNPGLWSPAESARQVTDALNRQMSPISASEKDMTPFKDYKMFQRR